MSKKNKIKNKQTNMNPTYQRSSMDNSLENSNDNTTLVFDSTAQEQLENQNENDVVIQIDKVQDEELKSNGDSEDKGKSLPKKKKHPFKGMFKKMGYTPTDFVNEYLSLLSDLEFMPKDGTLDFISLPLEEKFLDIKRRIEALYQEKVTVETQMQTLSEDFNEQNTQLLQQKANILQLHTENTNLKETIGDLRTSNMVLNNHANQASEEWKAKYESEKEVKEEKSRLASDLQKKLEEKKDENIKIINERNHLNIQLQELQSSKSRLQDQYNDLKERFDNCEVGQLSAEIEALNMSISQLEQDKDNEIALKNETEGKLEKTENELQRTKEKLMQSENQISAIKTKVIEQEGIISDKKNVIDRLKNEVEEGKRQITNANLVINNQASTIKSHKSEIEEKTGTIISLKKENNSLNNTISNQKAQISALESQKEQLIKQKEVEIRAKKDKEDFINTERDDYASSFCAQADALCTALSEPFLKSCDEEFDEQCKALGEKVVKPINALVREIKDIEISACASRHELEQKYYALIKEQMDDASGLTRIAQWQAYSCIPFMLDESRPDGLVVKRNIIKRVYEAASRLIAMVGLQYNIPALYAESISDNPECENVTGKRQLNIEFMCPTARSHKENIDISDIADIIIDVVEVGYTDQKGNNKKSQVII